MTVVRSLFVLNNRGKALRQEKGVYQRIFAPEIRSFPFGSKGVLMSVTLHSNKSHDGAFLFLDQLVRVHDEYLMHMRIYIFKLIKLLPV